MNILYCGDKNISDGLILSVLSFLRNTDERLNIYILTMAMTTESKKYKPVSYELAEMLDTRVKEKNPESSVSLFDITELFSADKPLANMDTRFTPCCMLRLFADKVEGLPDKILYLDNDVLCRRACSDFYNTDIADCEFVGVLDHYGKWFFRRNAVRFDYINSGVMLMNLKKIRETGLFEKCRERCRSKKMFMPDQSAINKLSDTKRIAPRRFNEQRKLRHDTVLQHFTTSFRFFPWIHTVSVKPWQTDRVHTVLKLHEYDCLFDEYILFKEEINNGKRNTDFLFDR